MKTNTHTDRQRETDTLRHKGTHWQTDTHTDRQTDTDAEIQVHRQANKHRYIMGQRAKGAHRQTD